MVRIGFLALQDDLHFVKIVHPQKVSGAKPSMNSKVMCSGESIQREQRHAYSKEHNLIFTQWKKMRHFQYLKQSRIVTIKDNDSTRKIGAK